MKTNYFIPFSFLVLLFLLGCQKLTEDEKAQLNPNTYFKTQADLDASVTAVYQLFCEDIGVGGTNFIIGCFGSDDLATHPASNKEPYRVFDQLNGTSDMWQVDSHWTRLYQSIYQANNVIANYPKVESTEALKNNAAAQAYFLRAWCYFWLVKQFGPVPLVLEGLDVDAQPPRAPESEVYNAIVSDLNTAIGLFPATLPVESNRANLFAAKALLADVYLNMTGWPLYKTENYALAATRAKEVMDANAFTLVPDYATVFTTNDNSECVFAFQFDVAGGKPQRFLGMFAIPEDEVALDNSAGWNDYCSEINFYKHRPICKRSWQTFYDTLKIRNADNETYTLTPYNLTGTHRPFYKKFRYGLGVPGAGDGCTETATKIVTMNPSSNKNTDVIRYPMVLLDYAEAKAMSAGVDQSCCDAINQVRTRAGLPNYRPEMFATQEAFRDSVVRERAYEFAGENGIRWFDIQRLQLLPKIISEREVGTENAIPPAYIADPSHAYLMPIPINELRKNLTWVQNAGY